MDQEIKEPAVKTKEDLILEKIAKYQRQLKKIKAKELTEERKRRNHLLIQVGALIEIANLTGLDKGTLLGGLLEVARTISNDPDKSAAWKMEGDKVLAEREAARKVK